MPITVKLQNPAGGTFEQPLRAGMIIGVLRDIREGDETSFGPTMLWMWEGRYTDGTDPKKTIVAAYNGDGTPFLLRDMTSTKFGRGRTPEKTAKARLRVEALLKREIGDDEPLDGLLEQCLGKAALLYLTEQNGYLNVTLVQPFKPGTIVPVPALTDGDDFTDPSDDGEGELPFA